MRLEGTDEIDEHRLEIFALFMLSGVFSTMLIPETKGLSLEELSRENQEEFIGGIAGTDKQHDMYSP